VFLPEVNVRNTIKQLNMLDTIIQKLSKRPMIVRQKRNATYDFWALGGS